MSNDAKKEIDIPVIKKSPFNPRKMSGEVKKGLKKSITEFGNISGIVLNNKTGNILAGNHRWEMIASENKGYKLKKLIGEYHAVMSAQDKFTGWIIRVVEWSLKKEKMANVTANSDMLKGEFTEDLQPLLEEIRDADSALVMDELRLSDMMLSIDSNFDDELDFDETKTELKRKKTIKNLEDDESGDKEPSAAKSIISSIKITMPSEHKDVVMEKILKILSKQPFYDELTIN